VDASGEEEEEEHNSDEDEIVNVVINCVKDVERLAQFSSRMKRAGLDFRVFPCFVPDDDHIRAAIDRGLVSPDILLNMNNRGWVGCGLAHITAIQYVALHNISIANIFEDDEVVPLDYKVRRGRVLKSLPRKFGLIKLNPLRPNGRRYRPGVLKMFNRNPLDNAWNSNYVVTSSGARKILHNLRNFSGSEQIDWYMSERITAARGTHWEVDSYTVDRSDALSTHCEFSSVKDEVAIDMAKSAAETENLGTSWHQ
jgi:GR25 family glycosyltransferase involved in LPS biosynthesis